MFLLFLLVRFGSVQPDPTDERAHHTSNDNGEADSPSVHLFTLKQQQLVFQQHTSALTH